MPYSSSLTDKQWEIIAPLLPKKMQTRPPKWTKRQILDGVFYQLNKGCNWGDLPKDLPPYSTVLWHYKQWRNEGVFDEIMSLLHTQVRQRAQKTKLDAIVNHRLTSSEEYVQCQCGTLKDFVTCICTNDIWRSIRWGCHFSDIVRKQTSPTTKA